MLTQCLFRIKKIMACFAMLTLSFHCLADSFIGQISGIDCAESGHLCPLEKFEQHLSQEHQFVLLTSQKHFLHLDGISRDILLRYVSKRVIVIGELNKDKQRVQVTELQVQQGEGLGHYESVWHQ